MKLTIIPSDGAVYKDNVCYLELDLSSCAIPADVHALQWQDTEGWIEFYDNHNETIYELPLWAVACLNTWENADYSIKNPAPLSSEQLLQNTKNKAKYLLEQTDWSVLSDVGLANSADFITYRGILRGLVINPVENPTFPTKPQAIWL